MGKKTRRFKSTHFCHGSQPVVDPDLPSSSQPNTSPVGFTAHDSVSEAGEPSSSNAATIQLQGMPSSSSDSKASDLNNKILTAAHAVDTKDVDAEVDRLIEYIIDLLEEKKTVKELSKTGGAKHSWHSSSESLNKFREVLSEAINVFKDGFPGEAKTETVTQGLLKGMGTAHLTTTGFLIAAHVLERFETIPSNNCLRVLNEICNVAKQVKKVRQRDGLREGMEESIKEAMGLIVEASIICSTQIWSSRGSRGPMYSYSRALTTKKLEDLQQRLQRMYRDMENEVTICLYDAIARNKVLEPDTNKYSSFINHRGPDTKKTLASHLDYRLKREGLTSFIDKDGLLVGDHFPSRIENVIKTASVHVAIFSPRYAESEWCLNELVLMLESGAPIISVFYHVRPNDLRRKDGKYAEDLRNLKNMKTHDPETNQEKPVYDSTTIKKWEAALSTVSFITGLDLLDTCNGDEGKPVEMIVQSVKKNVKMPGLENSCLVNLDTENDTSP